MVVAGGGQKEKKKCAVHIAAEVSHLTFDSCRRYSCLKDEEEGMVLYMLLLKYFN